MNRFAMTSTTLPLAVLVAALGARASFAIDINGVLGATLSQPQVHALLEPAGGGDLYVSAEGAFSMYGYLDTGSSGVLISSETALSLGLPVSGAIFSDVAVGGATHFEVSEPLRLRVNGLNDPDWGNPATHQTVYNEVYDSLRMQVGPTDFESNIDIFGMPVMIGKTVVMDPTQAIPLFFAPPAYLYAPNTPFNPDAVLTNPGIPTTSHHVQLSYGDFSRFTAVSPSGALGPMLSHNPFVGPNPVLQLEQNLQADDAPPPPVSFSFDGLHATGSLLLDTGGGGSFISSALAEKFHVRYVAGTFGTEEPELERFDPDTGVGSPLEDQFVLQLQGIGGVVFVPGFHLDTMVLHTDEGGSNDDHPNNIRYVKAPVLVYDVALFDPVTQQELVLDGILGMNFLMDSLKIDGFSIEERPSPYRWVTFDEPNGVLGLDLGFLVPEPSSYVMAGFGLAAFAGYAWRRRAALRRVR